ncbi:MAG: type II toxin-antitoxin system VapB family antitoxin [Solirubrobacterales bacterium]|nr:type II toxin-antitoxin system VapB family antitoxin [Solirubrobacterales bacterium]
MRTNIVIDQELMAEAQKLAGTKTMKETVDLALRELVDRRNRLSIIELRGKFPEMERHPSDPDQRVH